MTQIRDSNWFWGKKKSSKFLDFLSWLDSYINGSIINCAKEKELLENKNV
jgi:hypothetical protein